MTREEHKAEAEKLLGYLHGENAQFCREQELDRIASEAQTHALLATVDDEH